LDFQIKKIAGPGLKNFGTGAVSESEKVTPVTSNGHVSFRRIEISNP